MFIASKASTWSVTKREVVKVDGMFVISTALKDYFVSCGLPKEKIEIVNMTVDSNRFVDSRSNHQKSILPIVEQHLITRMVWMSSSSLLRL